ncbi:MAG: hypothetical protein IT290_04235 [Deltaproteobacteria bacterium]|nr:hypothetical protein [Deltaproteobacteria bacterium]
MISTRLLFDTLRLCRRFGHELRIALPLGALSLGLGATPSLAEESTFLKEHHGFFHLLRGGEPDLKLSAMYQPENDEEAGPGSYDLLDMSAGLEVPIPLQESLYLRAGFDYDARSYEFNSTSRRVVPGLNDTWHKISLTAGAGLFLGDDLLITGVARPGIYTDLEEMTDEDAMRLFGEGMLVYRINPGTQILAGAAYDEIYDDTPLYPLIGLRLMSEEGDLNVTLTFPREARIGVHISTDAEVYGGLWITGDEYRLHADDVEFDAHIHDRRIGGGLRYWANSTFSFQLEGGVLYDSELEFKIRGEPVFRGETQKTGYARLSMGLTF